MKTATPFTQRALLAATVCAFLNLPSQAQQEIGFIEDFALAENREEVLKQLIPGTQDYYYYHALHYQNTRQLDKLTEILGQWDKRFRNSGLRKQILHREALLNYEKDPRKW